MATDYSKKTVADLQDLLKSRSLPHSGKKAELIARLQTDDSEKASKPAATNATADEITDDFNIEVPGGEGSAASAAAVNAAGGKGQPPNPAAVPNQAVDTDPSKTEDLTVKKASAGDASAEGAGSEAVDGAAATTEAPGVDFSSGLKDSSVEEEAAKMRKRAERFGITKTEDDKKAEERAKKFGTEGTESKVVKGLDQALPERSRKRGRGGEEGGDQGARSAGKRSRVRGGGGGGRGAEKEGGSGWMSEKDKLDAEARRKKFATAS